MPPKAKYTREEIIAAALELVRKNGINALRARELGAKLGSSARPIFTVFRSMNEVREELIRTAAALYAEKISEEQESGLYPPYKSFGMAYIRFAAEESELFKLLFMRDRSEESERDSDRELDPVYRLLRDTLGLDEEQVRIFHLETWVYVHGIAVIIATGYLELDTALVSRMITDCYEGLKYRFGVAEGKEDANGCHTDSGSV